MLFTQADDLDFADDVALLFPNHQQMQDKLKKVEEKAAETGVQQIRRRCKEKNRQGISSIWRGGATWRASYISLKTKTELINSSIKNILYTLLIINVENNNESSSTTASDVFLISGRITMGKSKATCNRTGSKETQMGMEEEVIM